MEQNKTVKTMRRKQGKEEKVLENITKIAHKYKCVIGNIDSFDANCGQYQAKHWNWNWCQCHFRTRIKFAFLNSWQITKLLQNKPNIAQQEELFEIQNHLCKNSIKKKKNRKRLLTSIKWKPKGTSVTKQ